MNNSDPIPFLDLVTPHIQLEEELVSVFRSALKCAGFIGGPMVEGFERDFALFCETKYCVGVASGTDALRFALIAAGVSGGDIVITAPNTFIATTEAISQAGALPDFVDIDPSTYNMDPEKLAEYLETKCDRGPDGKPVHRGKGRPVAAIVPVHLYGLPTDMDPILALARRYGLIVIEDACQAHGAGYYSTGERRWQRVGSIGAAAAFSFYPGKNLGACGEAGAVTTDDESIARKVKILRDHGQARRYYHDIEGYNGRLDAIQAGILAVKLRLLADWNEFRRQCANQYHELLASTPCIDLPTEPSWAKAVYHLYVIMAGERDRLQKHLLENGIHTGLHYPLPLHLQNSYAGLTYGPGSFPVAEAIASRILSLPMYPGLQYQQQQRVADEIIRFLNGH